MRRDETKHAEVTSAVGAPESGVARPRRQERIEYRVVLVTVRGDKAAIIARLLEATPVLEESQERAGG